MTFLSIKAFLCLFLQALSSTPLHSFLFARLPCTLRFTAKQFYGPTHILNQVPLAVDKSTGCIGLRSCRLICFAFKRIMGFYDIYLLAAKVLLDLVVWWFRSAHDQPFVTIQFYSGFALIIVHFSLIHPYHYLIPLPILQPPSQNQ